MTYEEAIIDIRENIQPIVGGKSLDIAISALEKQIPKRTEIKKDCSYLMLDIKNIKAEAYKEFAERLKERAMQKFDWNEYVEVEDIDNLVKEMVVDNSNDK